MKRKIRYDRLIAIIAAAAVTALTVFLVSRGRNGIREVGFDEVMDNSAAVTSTIRNGSSALTTAVQTTSTASQSYDTDTTQRAVYTASAAFTTTTSAETAAVSIETVTKIPSCRAAAVYCVSDGKMLHSENIGARIAPASLTKLLTASTALKYMSPDSVMTAGSEQAFVQPYSSLCGLHLGSTSSLRDLLTGMLMSSGNDAAYTVAVETARHVSMNEQMSDSEAVSFFCGLMNTRADEIGMSSSRFVNPDG